MAFIPSLSSHIPGRCFTTGSAASHTNPTALPPGRACRFIHSQMDHPPPPCQQHYCSSQLQIFVRFCINAAVIRDQCGGLNCPSDEIHM
jgi:hypothetical protein